MFDTRIVGKRIRQSRMAKNMTQMDLADAMGVSYQAVSNWERGNSMPDISKLEDLCRVLEIAIPELLGAQQRETAAVQKALAEEPLTMEEIADVAPMLPPKQMKERVQQTSREGVPLETLIEMAVYLDDDVILEMLEDIQVDSLTQISQIAPFLSDEALDGLVRKAPITDTEGISALAVFLGEDTLNYVVQRYEGTEYAGLLAEIAVFLSEEAIDSLVERAISAGDLAGVAEEAVFMSSETVNKLAKACIAQRDMETLKKIAVFM